MNVFTNFENLYHRIIHLKKCRLFDGAVMKIGTLTLMLLFLSAHLFSAEKEVRDGEAVIASNVSSQQITVSGKVTDDQGNSLPGVSVVLKGVATSGTSTNGDGNFSLNVNNSTG